MSSNDELETTIQELSDENERLVALLDAKQEEVFALDIENAMLRARINELENGLPPGGKVTIGTGDRTPRILQEEG